MSRQVDRLCPRRAAVGAGGDPVNGRADEGDERQVVDRPPGSVADPAPDVEAAGHDEGEVEGDLAEGHGNGRMGRETRHEDLRQSRTARCGRARGASRGSRPTRRRTRQGPCAGGTTPAGGPGGPAPSSRAGARTPRTR